MLTARPANSKRVVVGVDGSPGSRSALFWAAEEAQLLGAALLVLHAPDATDQALVSRRGAAALRAVDEVAEHLLRVSASAASAHRRALPVTTRLVHDHPADALIEASEGSELVVVGRHGLGGITMSMLGSVSHRVAAHAHCPVAVVPDEVALRTRAVAHRVVVGVADAPAARMALHFALGEARRHSSSLVLVHTGSASADHEWSRHELANARADNPDLIIDSCVVSGPATDALLAESEDAQLVVIGCRHSEDKWSTRLGTVPSELLHRATCPIVVVGQEAAHDEGRALLVGPA